MTTALEFWTGKGGNDYVDRNTMDAINLSRRAKMWSQIFENIASPYSVLEVGANIGINLVAIKRILPPVVHCAAVEPNSKAADLLLRLGVANEVWTNSADDLYIADNRFDVVFTSGVLIHIEPSQLLKSCKEIHRVSKRYVICAEYFSDQPIEIEYRGSFIWKRDWGQFWLDNFEDLRPINCGFAWRGLTGLDNITWWVFEKC